MGGEISVKSPPTGANKGTEFIVTLPCKKIAITGTTAAFPDLKKHVHQPKLIGAAETKNEFPNEADSNEKPLILLLTWLHKLLHAFLIIVLLLVEME
jgi:hypothetical protein